ncbi:nucleotidyltransferase domain-containing protein [Sedimentibacter hydroxybenzoicus DSM 7310]|uniref:Nucleotidyltransferase domain-containing protein n=1 Tax=Sedimentibacter hydroxybenzoicus DSM 7310 TaxID=1123245 RepID=A0A974GX26_SEDHY|nr:nucleotidyltransferase domain-containing protein [Sedimentibacter hydroxybenzoicus]NYB74650.1 nucleotidyltransferase domain-containing protein [Sedimentibacter hydroxybenzoicus DSM 7310]HCX61803.1 nucleotidyltransferase domain-containing protein [Clostridiales bacterium]
MLDKETVVKLAERYALEVVKMLNPQAVVLFGSYAKGTAKVDSDIDIAVILNDFTGDYLEIYKQLYRLRRNISADIEPVLLDSSRDDSGFVAEVLKTGQILGTHSN